MSHAPAFRNWIGHEFELLATRGQPVTPATECLCIEENDASVATAATSICPKHGEAEGEDDWTMGYEQGWRECLSEWKRFADASTSALARWQKKFPEPRATVRKASGEGS